MTAHPVISVIIPTYNRERYLRDAVASVIAQTYADWELLVVDDGSTDGTRAYLTSLTEPRVRTIFGGHSGNPALVRNVGARAALGSHLAFLDSDDVWRPEKLRLQMEDLQAHPECGWSYTAYLHMNEHGSEAQWLHPRPWVPYRGWMVEQVVGLQALIATPTVMVQRRLFEAVRGFDESLRRCEDYDLWIRLAEASPGTVVPAPLVHVRQHQEDRRAGLLELLQYMNQICNGLLARSSSPRLRRLCRRQRARVNLEMVNRFRALGRYRDAREALSISFPYARWHPGWWAALLKIWLRTALPSRARTGPTRRAAPPDGDLRSV